MSAQQEMAHFLVQREMVRVMVMRTCARLKILIEDHSLAPEDHWVLKTRGHRIVKCALPDYHARHAMNLAMPAFRPTENSLVVFQ